MTTNPPTPVRDINLMEWVASHECGHGLIACETGMRTRWMRIRRGWFGRIEGFTEVACEDVSQAQKRDLLLLCVSGIAATSLWLQRVHHWPAGAAHRAARGSRWCDDRKLFEFYAQGTTYTLGRACAEVEPILRRYWPRIDRATAQLAATQKLRAAAV